MGVASGALMAQSAPKAAKANERDEYGGTIRMKLKDEHGSRYRLKLYWKRSVGDKYFGVARLSRAYGPINYPFFLFTQPWPRSVEFNVNGAANADGFGFTCFEVVDTKGSWAPWCDMPLAGWLKRQANGSYRGNLNGCPTNRFNRGHLTRPSGYSKLRVKDFDRDLPASTERRIDALMHPPIRIGDVVLSMNGTVTNKVVGNALGWMQIGVLNSGATRSFYSFEVVADPGDGRVSIANQGEELPTPGTYEATGRVQYGSAFQDPGKHTPIGIRISTSSDLPDSTVFTIRLRSKYGGVLLDERRVVYGAESFLENARLVEPESPRVVALRSYYRGAITDGELGATLDANINDPKARLWKSYFIFNGRAGWSRDDFKARFLAEGVIDTVFRTAELGDLEALCLVALAKRMGFTPNAGGNSPLMRTLQKPKRDPSLDYLLDLCSEKGFEPASMEYALYLLDHGPGGQAEAFRRLKALDEKGFSKAGLYLGYCYERGLGTAADSDRAFLTYKALHDKEDIDATANLANLCFRTGRTEEGMAYVNEGVARGSARCMFILANHYACTKPLFQPELGLCVEWMTKAAEQGEPEAMLALGMLYMGTDVDTLHNLRRGALWIRKAAETGNTEAMQLLAGQYARGYGVEEDLVLERYWLNQAAIRGVGDGAPYDVEAEPMVALFDHIDLSPTRYVREFDQYGNQVNSYYEGPSVFEAIGGTLASTFQATHSERRSEIDAMRSVMEKDGHTIYAATLTTALETPIKLQAGDGAKISASGWIEAGTYAGTRDPNGARASGGAGGYIGSLIGGDFAAYNRSKDCPHASLIGGVEGTQWACLGSRASYTAPSSGTFILAVNDVDTKGNRGYFDVEVVVRSVP